MYRTGSINEEKNDTRKLTQLFYHLMCKDVRVHGTQSKSPEKTCGRQKKKCTSISLWCLLRTHADHVLWKWLSLIFLTGQFTHVSNSVLKRANVLSSKCVLIMYLTIWKYYITNLKLLAYSEESWNSDVFSWNTGEDYCLFHLKYQHSRLLRNGRHRRCITEHLLLPSLVTGTRRVLAALNGIDLSDSKRHEGNASWR